jgi:LuxR family maltose regulon positive regulatory protein
MQQHSLLATKLHIPPIRPELVSRPRLIERLNADLTTRGAFSRALTLVSAPAGFGKTTLVSEWVAGCERLEPKVRAAWLSLDEGDNDPARFMAYMITALQTIEANIGKGALSALQSPQPPPAEAVLASLINEVAAIPGSIILVLDDHHTLESPPVNNALAFLLERLPPQMHLVIASREDPPLPLARLRARGQLTELHATDLRFTTSEAAEFLNQAMGLDLSTEDIAVLERRTEGWIAGLQLAGLSMQGREDTTSFIQSFTGSHRYVLDYLVEEVLERQPESVQTFLLRTAILDGLTGTLCDAVTGQDNGRATLEMLDRANVFIVPLDDERRWYRYHHLFRDLLRSRLQQTQPGRIAHSQKRASEWFEKNGFANEAIEYALKADDFERAIILIEAVAESVWARGELKKLGDWLNALPNDLILAKPNLCIFHAMCQHTVGQGESAEWSLQAAERAFDPQAENASDPLANAQRRMLGRVAATRALIAFYKGNITEIVKNANQALECLPDEDLSWRSSAAVALADAQMLIGDLNEAHRTLMEALEISKAAGNPYRIILVYCRLAIALRHRGQLQRVLEICSEQVQFSDSSSMVCPNATGMLLAIWGETLAEMNDLSRALHKATEGLERAERSGNVVSIGWSYLCLVRIMYSRGDFAGAEELVEMMKVASRDHAFPPWVETIMTSWQVRIWLSQEDIVHASWWAKQRRLDVEEGLTHTNEMEFISLARVLISQDKQEEAIGLLQSILGTEQSMGRTDRVIEIMILLALAYRDLDNMQQSLSTLSKVLSLAEPESFIRTFVDEGPPMARLLYEALTRGIAPDYVRRLLAAFPVAEPEQDGPSETQTPEPDRVEPLSERELEVLQLIAEGLTNPEIASRLFLALNTVKSHTRNIYGKLGVHSRTQAVAKAQALGVLPSI